MWPKFFILVWIASFLRNGRDLFQDGRFLPKTHLAVIIAQHSCCKHWEKNNTGTSRETFFYGAVLSVRKTLTKMSSKHNFLINISVMSRCFDGAAPVYLCVSAVPAKIRVKVKGSGAEEATLLLLLLCRELGTAVLPRGKHQAEDKQASRHPMWPLVRREPPRISSKD